MVTFVHNLARSLAARVRPLSVGRFAKIAGALTGFLVAGGIAYGAVQLSGDSDPATPSPSTPAATQTPTTTPTQTPTPLASLTVTVIDRFSTSPLADVEIRMDGLFVGRTDSTGQMVITSVQRERHYIKAVVGEAEGGVSIHPNDAEEVRIVLDVPRRLDLRVVDVETDQPVVGYDVTLLDSLNPRLLWRSRFRTDDHGQTTVEGIPPGRYNVTLEGAPGTVKPSEVLEVPSELPIDREQVLVVDMPNPEFRGSISCTQHPRFIGDRYGVCKVKLTNLSGDRSIASKGTQIVFRVWVRAEYAGAHMLANSFSVRPGETEEFISERMYEFAMSDSEVVVATIYDGWEYTPENLKEIGTSNIPVGIFDEAIRGVMLSGLAQGP